MDGLNDYEDDGFVFCYECEESFNCPDACRLDGCECGLKTVTDEQLMREKGDKE